ncbi:putative glycyl-tRNA synthetase [Actinoplanes missouriensis 431]|uniref:Multifunctional fusion protein n=1 Tax=Actinoplanes missouriensis (strain ATCC 14538 / DSM 43046 / CBS 188.64 / JCM 3121 / NBRC 102363 / NCIMB 12654 / NRRL B-3342 / UNCC 431) TaxID=512565 RepID=I0HCG0_ACTM4|nr:glycine--tRNA ligase [Actinoplanes missouriensis]BAL90697.1 putative glycyl-tRNA synthetase [Actinoplanes missouriensis 431]
MLTMQDALARLTAYWTDQGALVVQPMNTEVGAGTLNPATFLRVLGPEPWKVVYVEPSVRPDDSRYGENPNRLQTHTQLQVILKPDPGNPQELYLGSLRAIGIDVAAHDVRFVEDNWASPALGAWGLGWEVWLDGLEITQFTYFQQAGGLNLDPVSVEITYGIERIIMALQDKTHFKEIEYATGVSYGEVFGQSEYEMSRYYLDDADIEANRRLLDLYAGEAQRMIDAGLPVPAHTFVLKCSQAFNVLDARGAVSTAERAAEFARMRRLAGDVAKLWVARRAELGLPLGTTPALDPARPAASTQTSDDARTLVFEIGTEELPPGELRSARAQLLRLVTEGLAGTRLAHGEIRVYGTPRRLIAVVPGVGAREDDHVRLVKGPKTTAAYGGDGAPTKALEGFARSQGVSVDAVTTVELGGVPHVVVEKHEAGGAAPAVLATVLAQVVTGLRAAKNMRWNDPKLSFSRPIRWLTALWGDDVVPVTVSTLAAGRTTRLLRTAAEPVIAIESAETFLETLGVNGIVADHEDRRELIVIGAQDLVYPDGKIDVKGESSLIDQVTDLVEQPLPLLGTFDEGYLDLPDAVLTTVMRKHQRYLPVRDADGALLPMFVTVANGPVDVELVRAGNEAVLRARYEDAAFFYRADLATSPADMRARLDRLTFTDKLGSMADRAARISSLAHALAADRGISSGVLERAAALVKFDLGSQLVTEMTSLAGVMARDYALRAGEDRAVAQAVYEAELPRNTGDELPRTVAGALLSVADRLDVIAGLAATVGLPTGSSDPFALRRAFLGLIAVHRATPALAGLDLVEALRMATAAQPVPVADDVVPACAEFLAKRLEQVLTEEGQPVDRVRAVLSAESRPARVDLLLAQLNTAVGDPGFRAVAAAIQRARRIVPAGTEASYPAAALKEPAELALHAAVGEVSAFTDISGFVGATRGLVAPLNTFFDEVFVMADDPELRAARLGLLATVRDLGDGLLDWSHLRLQ